MQASGRQPDGAPRLAYMPGLDGLRGVAVGAVVLFHAGHLAGGYLGVDLFFVLSGYLITSLLVKEGTGTGRIALVRFWGRRARRLLPALGVLLVGVAAYAGFAARPEELHRIRWDGLATLAYVANWREVFAGADYWALFTVPSPLAHTWSLAIEEQFYVLWPLVVLAVMATLRATARRRGTTEAGRGLAFRLLVLCTAAAGFALALQAFWQWRSGWPRVYYGTDTRAFALFCGAGLACFTAWRTGRPPTAPAPGGPGTRRVLLEVAGLAAAAFLAVAFVIMDGDSRLVQRGGLAACSLAGMVVIATAAHPHRLVLTTVLSWRPLVWLGLVSYGVYLYHWPIDVWLDTDRTGLDGWALFGVQTALTLVVAALSYRFVEQPIRHRTVWTRRSVWTVPAAGFAGVGVLLVVATLSSLPGNVQTTREALAQAAAESEHYEGTTIMVIGNSVALYLGKGLKRVTRDQPVRIVSNAVINCDYPLAERIRTFPGIVSRGDNVVDCDRDWQATAEAYRADYVVYTRSGVGSAELWIDGVYHDTCSPEYARFYRESLTADVARFADLGATTVLITAVPSRRHLEDPDDPDEGYLAGTACGNDILRDVAAADPDHVELIDLEAHLCDEGTCIEHVNGIELRPDGLHYDRKGSRIVAKWVLDQLGLPSDPID